jgi:acyl CoA:acetate/3-ketoacid CoA transferase
MTRTVALGAVIGFAITVLVLALWERSASTSGPAVDAGVIPGAEMFVDPRLQRGLNAMPMDRRVEKVMIAPMIELGDAGSP